MIEAVTREDCAWISSRLGRRLGHDLLIDRWHRIRSIGSLPIDQVSNPYGTSGGEHQVQRKHQGAHSDPHVLPECARGRGEFRSAGS